VFGTYFREVHGLPTLFSFFWLASSIDHYPNASAKLLAIRSCHNMSLDISVNSTLNPHVSSSSSSRFLSRSENSSFGRISLAHISVQVVVGIICSLGGWCCVIGSPDSNPERFVRRIMRATVRQYGPQYCSRFALRRVRTSDEAAIKWTRNKCQIIWLLGIHDASAEISLPFPLSSSGW